MVLRKCLYISSMYKSLYTTSMFLIYFLYSKLSQGLQRRGPSPYGARWQPDGPRSFLPEELGRRRDQSNVVIFHWLPIDITIVDKNCHHSLKHTLLHLTHLWNFFSYCLHTDVCRQLPFPSRSIDGALEIRKKRGSMHEYQNYLEGHLIKLVHEPCLYTTRQCHWRVELTEWVPVRLVIHHVWCLRAYIVRGPRWKRTREVKSYTCTCGFWNPFPHKIYF